MFAQAEGPALVIRDTGCGAMATDGSIIMPLDFQAVVTTTGIGKNVVLTCRGQQPASIPAPEQTVSFDYASTGRLCDTPFGVSENWVEVITPSGQVTFSCRVNPSGS